MASMIIELPVFALGSAPEPGLTQLYQLHITALALLHAAFGKNTQKIKIFYFFN
jgi:hypothetical protein